MHSLRGGRCVDSEPPSERMFMHASAYPDPIPQQVRLSGLWSSPREIVEEGVGVAAAAVVGAGVAAAREQARSMGQHRWSVGWSSVAVAKQAQACGPGR